jgi:hypothetical protein
MPHQIYAVVCRSHAYFIVGPFEDHAALAAWGDHEAENGDDPRWQEVKLPDGQTMPTAHDASWHPGYSP